MAYHPVLWSWRSVGKASQSCFASAVKRQHRKVYTQLIKRGRKRNIHIFSVKKGDHNIWFTLKISVKCFLWKRQIKYHIIHTVETIQSDWVFRQKSCCRKNGVSRRLEDSWNQIPDLSDSWNRLSGAGIILLDID